MIDKYDIADKARSRYPDAQITTIGPNQKIFIQFSLTKLYIYLKGERDVTVRYAGHATCIEAHVLGDPIASKPTQKVEEFFDELDRQLKKMAGKMLEQIAQEEQ